MGWLITLCILVLLAILPLGASAVYNADGFFAYLVVGPLRLKLFPVKKKEKKKQQKPKKKIVAEVPKQKTKTKTGGSVTDFLPLVQTALNFLNDFRRKLRVNRLELKVILAGGDPCDLAVNYGRAWAALGNLMPHLEKFLVIKKRELEIECDFIAAQTLIYAHVDITITLGRLLYLGVSYGIRLLRDYMKIMNKRKGGAKI